MLQNAISHYFGVLCAKKFPRAIQNFINKSYVNYFKIDLSEFLPASNYDSLNALFTRSLNQPRKLDEGFISPSDGKIFYAGKGAHNQAFSIKNCDYNVKELGQMLLSIFALYAPVKVENMIPGGGRNG